MGLRTSLRFTGPFEIPGMVVGPSGGAVLYVGTAAQVAALGQVGEAIADRVYTTVNAALNVCVTGRGDRIYVLPGYTESIAAADAWSSLAATDVSVIGLGQGTNRPAITWSAATSTVLMDVANFKLQNLQLLMAGALASTTALTVAAPITVSAAGCEISDCFIQFGVDVDQIVTIGVTTTAAADYFVFDRNTCYADTTAECTTFLQLVGADWLEMHDNKIQGATSSTTVGTVRFLTTASLAIDWRRNVIQNLKAASIHAVTCMNGVTGTVDRCSFGILDNATLAGFVPGGAGNGPQLFGCYTANLAAEEGALTTPVST